MSFATANAHPAAKAPMMVTRNAPSHGLRPVILLLKNPKMKRHIRVNNAEIFRDSIGVSINI